MYSMFTYQDRSKQETHTSLSNCLRRLFVRNLQGLRITTLKSNNGKEYLNNELDDYLKQNEISRLLSVRRTPQQNDIAEKINHTLFEMTRCSLIDSGISNELWV